MVKRLACRWTNDDQNILRFDAKLTKDGREFRIWREAGKVNIFLRAPISFHLSVRGAVALKCAVGETVGNDDACRQPERQVIRGLVLIIHQRH